MSIDITTDRTAETQALTRRVTATDSETIEAVRSVDDTPSLVEGQRLGNYVLDEELGAGAMGVVYRAFDTKLDRRVAIKRLKRQTDGKARKRFMREAQAMARLSHPNVVQVYDVDEIDGHAFIVMEFIRGATLAQWLGQRTRTPAEIIEVFCAAARGLGAAHSRGLVHRDFKPANVMIDETGRAVVTDFGLAKEWKRHESSTAELRAGALLDNLTTGVRLIGTPAYMAPEQFDGLEITSRVDQFSFCVALWEALYGRRPFRAKTMLELTVAVKTRTFDFPEDEREVPHWVRRVLERGLHLEPAQRWPSMDALVEALTTAPEPATDTEITEPPGSAQPWWFWFGLGLAAASVVGLGVWLLAR